MQAHSVVLPQPPTPSTSCVIPSFFTDEACDLWFIIRQCDMWACALVESSLFSPNSAYYSHLLCFLHMARLNARTQPCSPTLSTTWCWSLGLVLSHVTCSACWEIDYGALHDWIIKQLLFCYTGTPPNPPLNLFTLTRPYSRSPVFMCKPI